MSQMWKEKPSKGLIAVIVVAGVVGSAVGSAVVTALLRTPHTDASVDDVLVKTASELNRNMPMMVDELTRIDSTAALPGKKFLYKYTILNMDAMPSSDEFVEGMRPTLVNTYKTSHEMSEFRKMEVTLIYSYSDEEGNEFARVEVEPQDIE